VRAFSGDADNEICMASSLVLKIVTLGPLCTEYTCRQEILLCKGPIIFLQR